ncbi:MAG: RagB/SusD family nutrient uptake outer membrane protein [Phocaeicola sp.]|nr:RagB/SusD family nutrient uptake outer membrane protein [Phocaeicola sp.]
MKLYKLKFVAAMAMAGLALPSCNDFLDKEPMSVVTPENYLNDESQLVSYLNGIYTAILPSHEGWNYGTFGDDGDTDNQARMSYNNIYVPGQYKVGAAGGNWEFSNIYKCNYFLEKVVPLFESGSITGAADNIKHYIGEAYFLRAYAYYLRYWEFGDFPIIKTTLPDDKEMLTEASKRYPRNEVARFILEDLDKAIELMEKNPDSRRTRINKESALLFKSRVALFEGTWLKYFKGTAFVPKGEGWGGSSKDYNSSYEYPSGSIDNEINFFLEESMKAAKEVSGLFTLVDNTGKVQQDLAEPANPYMDMFGSEDLSGYSEVLLWRQYSKALGVTHCVCVAAQHGNYGVGVTRGLVDGFLMSNGLPIYASGSGYHGDDNISNVRKDRDSRLSVFLKEPGQKNILVPSSEGTHAIPEEPNPLILRGNAEEAYPTGYSLRKGNSYLGIHLGNGQSYTGSITFRGAEAYLNYMEACYERYGNLDETAKSYWRALRRRSKVDTDFEKTIATTEMDKEAKNDWGAYSAGKLVDPTLYNIRRERRCELMAEALRWEDLRRWRALDQMIETPYHIEGFKVWGEMKDWYEGELIYGLDNDKSNVSSPDRSMYLRPYEKTNKSLVLDGYKWAMAHYLSPIAISHFLITSETGADVESSPIYQNPGWPTEANLPPIGVK